DEGESMSSQRRLQNRRKGATVVETAMVLLPILMLTFGIFEYGRFLMHLNMYNNAIREGCRYAVVNNTNSTVNTATKAVVDNYLGNELRNYKNLAVTLSGTHSGTATAVTDLAPGD